MNVDRFPQKMIASQVYPGFEVLDIVVVAAAAAVADMEVEY